MTREQYIERKARRIYRKVKSFLYNVIIVLIITLIIYLIVSNIFKSTINENDYEISYYSVESGDTLWGIAKENALESDDLRDYIAYIKSANKMQSSTIRVGDELEILVPKKK